MAWEACPCGPFEGNETFCIALACKKSFLFFRAILCCLNLPIFGKDTRRAPRIGGADCNKEKETWFRVFENKTVGQTEEELGTRADRGLTQEEARARLEKEGPNELAEQKGKTRLQMFLAQLNEPMIYILFAAAGISLLLREFSDAAVVLTVVLLNAAVGVIQEGKAQQALEELKKMSSPTALTRRDGQVVEIPAAQLVRGDVVLLEAGRQAPADLRLTVSASLKTDEAALTGESLPVEKDADRTLEGDSPLGDRVNMVYMTSSVVYGRGEGIVTATGMNTEIGKIARMINDSQEEATPLQKRLADLGKLLGGLALALCAALFVLALVQGRDVMEMLITAISLAVAAVPEGLPAVVTIVLALGVQRLAKSGAIVRRLPSVETLGAVTVVCSDKTGTLTQNKMTVTHCYCDETLAEAGALGQSPAGVLLARGLALCCDASIQGGQRVGDPTEIALVELAAQLGLDKDELDRQSPRVGELAFDSDRKMMTTLHRQGETTLSFTKGAPDQVLRRCQTIQINGQTRPITDQDRQNILDAMSRMSRQALRVLALACRQGDQAPREEELTFIGLVGMIDPPREEARQAVASFQNASVRTVMITGDHRDTALAIAKQLGIAEDESQCLSGEELDRMTEQELADKIEGLRVFARVSPEHKSAIVKALRAKGHIVSMTGDGVNDAPSLKAADIGVAMGVTGTDVAKSAADMVLSDDNFATIQKAIQEGRGIYANIKKSVLFLLSSNFGEISAMFVAILAGLASPLKAIHILWVNLITDSLPGLALGVDQNDPKSLMNRPPRDPKESLFAQGGLAVTIFYGLVIAGLTLTAFLLTPARLLAQQGQALSLTALKALLQDPLILAESQTFAFTVLGMSQLFHAVGMRDVERSVFRSHLLGNRLMLLALAVGFSLQIAVTEIPFLVQVFGTYSLSLQDWLLLTALSAVPLLLHELLAGPLGRTAKQRG